MTDQMTFFLSFLAIFGGIGYYLWRLERNFPRLRLLALICSRQGSSILHRTRLGPCPLLCHCPL